MGLYGTYGKLASAIRVSLRLSLLRCMMSEMDAGEGVSKSFSLAIARMACQIDKGRDTDQGFGELEKTWNVE